MVGTVQNEEQSHTLLFLHYSMGKTDIVFFVGGGGGLFGNNIEFLSINLLKRGPLYVRLGKMERFCF